MRARTWPVLIAALLVAGAISAYAQDTADIVVAGKIVARVRDKGPYGSVMQRRAAVDKQIAEAISKKEVGVPQMSLRQENGLWTIYCGTTRLMSVYPAEAEANGLEERELAALWLRNFERELPNAEPTVDRVKRLGNAAWEAPVPNPGVTPVDPPPTTPPTGLAPSGRSTAVLAVLDAFQMVRALSDAEFDRARDELAENLITRLVPYIDTFTRIGGPRTIGGPGTSPAPTGAGPALAHSGATPPVPTEDVGVGPLPAGPTPMPPWPTGSEVRPIPPGPTSADASRVPQKQRIRRKWQALEEPLRTMREQGDPRAAKIEDLLSIVRRDFYADEFDSAEAAVDAALALAGLTVE